jgi:hypothetical protein
MDQLLASASPLVRDLIGMLAIMAGSILLVGALFFRKPRKPSERKAMPSMRSQARTIPPKYKAKGPGSAPR